MGASRLRLIRRIAPLVLCFLFVGMTQLVWAQASAGPGKKPETPTAPAPSPAAEKKPPETPSPPPTPPTEKKPESPAAAPSTPAPVDKKEAEKPSPSTTPAAPSLLPPQVATGSMLVIYAHQEKAFASPACVNEVIFPGPKGDIRMRAQFVSPEGGAIAVPLPEQALAGRVTVRSGDKEVGKVDVVITKPTGDSLGLTIFYGIMALFPVALFVAFLGYLGHLLRESAAANKWNIGGALSEDIDRKKRVIEEDGKVRTNDKTGEPLYELESISSSSASRLIAFIGLFAIITWIIALLVPATYFFYSSGRMPDLGNASTFLAAQAAIFTPYIANKIAGALKGEK